MKTILFFLLIGMNFVCAKVIMTMFAGRRKYLRVMDLYLSRLVELNYVDKIELWDFAKDKTDKEFIKQLATKPGYVVIGIPSHLEVQSGNKKWHYYYQYYSDSKHLADDDILLKIDDDIFYMDVSQFPHYLDVIRSSRGLVFPNIINSEVGGYVEAIYGVHDLVSVYNQSLFERYHVVPYNTNDTIDFDNIPSDDHMTTWFTNRTQAETIHHMFLTNYTRFFINTTDNVLYDGRVSINCLGGTGLAIRTAYHFYVNAKFPKRYEGLATDERFLSVLLRKYTGYCNKIVPSFNIVHFAYTFQSRSKWEKPVIEKYYNFSKNILGIV